MSLLIDDLKPQTDNKGSFLEVMGATKKQVVLVYADDATRTFDVSDLPKEKYSAGTKLYLKEDGSIESIVSPTAAKGKPSTSGSNSCFGELKDPLNK